MSARARVTITVQHNVGPRRSGRGTPCYTVAPLFENNRGGPISNRRPRLVNPGEQYPVLFSYSTMFSAIIAPTTLHTPGDSVSRVRSGFRPSSRTRTHITLCAQTFRARTLRIPIRSRIYIYIYTIIIYIYIHTHSHAGPASLSARPPARPAAASINLILNPLLAPRPAPARARPADESEISFQLTWSRVRNASLQSSGV